MDYAIYFDAGGIVYRLPVNPEEISRSGTLETEQYRMLDGTQAVVPVGRTLEEISFKAEFPHDERTYSNTGFQSADAWERALKEWVDMRTVVRFIASNGIGDDVNMEVLLTQVQVTEQAGEEGDKYIDLKLLEYVAPSKRYLLLQNAAGQDVFLTEGANPAITAGKTHTVVKGDTLWGIAKKYYGNGGQYKKIHQANSGQIKNPNLIYPGQVLTIPG